MTDIPIMEKTMPTELHVVVRLEDGSYWATVNEYPGVFAAGRDLEELRQSVEDGLSLVLAGPGEPPVDITLGPLELVEEPLHASASASLVLA